MTRIHRSLAIAVSLFALAPASARGAEPARPGAPAQKPKPLSQSLTGGAKADFEAGKLLAGDGDFAGALIKFQSSYDAAKDPRLLWNVAFCQKNLRHYSKVVATLERYLQEGAAALSAQDKKDAQDLIQTIEPFTTKVTLQVNEAGAQIFIDDEPVGTSPLPGPLVLDIGERRLRVEKDNFVKFEKALMVGGSAQTTTNVVLERIVHEGKLIVEAPAGAAVFIDDKEVGHGKVEQTLAAGGHQLRVVAAGMHPYQTEIVVQDKETRQLNVALEAEAAADKPKLRVAVGCADPEPKAPTDGLVVYTDNMEVLPPGPVKSRLSPELGRNVVEYVEYPIDSGKHNLRIVSKNCEALDQSVDVDPVAGALVSGALPSARSILVRGPEGAPGWGRLGLGAWFAGFQSVKENLPETYKQDGYSMTGFSLDAGLVDRWFAAYINYSYATGTYHRETFFVPTYAIPSDVSAKASKLDVRFGPRFPFHYVAFGFGAVAGAEQLNLDPVRTGGVDGVFGVFAEIDIQPLCDWGIFAQGGVDVLTEKDAAAFGTMQFGAFWEPNGRCRLEQSTQLGLKAGNSAPAGAH
jgi:hypothetical protein